MNKKLLLTLAIFGVMTTGLVTVKPAYGFWPFDAFKNESQQEAETNNQLPLIIQKLVDRFGLNQDEVKQVFEETRTERQGQMQAGFEEKLNQEVADGNLTEEQKQLILTKHEELKAKRQADKDSWQNMTREQRQEVKQNQRQEMETWANDNGIDLKYFGGMGIRGRFPREMKPGFDQ